ncbi:MAG: FkbM family methyltransferase [Planctomycetes bacterium]|nr:FkbM family methyltransferase [Planctomycetota bacterium]
MALYNSLRGKGLRNNKLFGKLHRLVVRTFLSKKGFILETKERGGSVKFLPFEEESFLMQIIGDHVEGMTRIVSDRLTSDSVFVDVGAYEGLYTFYAGRRAINGTIYSFEPNPEMFRIMQENVSNNKIGNVIAVNKAVRDKVGKVNFFVDEKDPCCSSTHIENIHQLSEKGSITIDSTSLDSFLVDEGKIKRVDFVKIDAEGDDGLVVRGMKKVIEKFRPKILLELWLSGLNSAEVSPLEVFKIFQSYGYKPSLISDCKKGDLVQMSWDDLFSSLESNKLMDFSNLLVE